MQPKDVLTKYLYTFPILNTEQAKAMTEQGYKQNIQRRKLMYCLGVKHLPDIVNMVKVNKTSNTFINIVLLIIVSMGILNTMLMSVLERFRGMVYC